MFKLLGLTLSGSVLASCSANTTGDASGISAAGIATHVISSDSLWTDVQANTHGDLNQRLQQLSFTTFSELYADMLLHVTTAPVVIDGHEQADPRQLLLSNQASFEALDTTYGTIAAYFHAHPVRERTLNNKAAFRTALDSSVIDPAGAAPGTSLALGDAGTDARNAPSNSCATYQVQRLDCNDAYAVAINNYDMNYTHASVSDQQNDWNNFCSVGTRCYQAIAPQYPRQGESANGQTAAGTPLADCPAGDAPQPAFTTEWRAPKKPEQPVVTPAPQDPPPCGAGYCDSAGVFIPL